MMRDFKSTPTKRCVIYFYEGWLSVSPTLIEVARSIASIDFEVVIYCGDSSYCPLSDFSDSSNNPRVIYSQPYHASFEYRVISKLISKFGVHSLSNLLNMYLFISRAVLLDIRSTKHKADHVFIGVDTNGIIAAYLHSFFVRTKSLTYLSLELADRLSFKGFDRFRRRLECLCFKACDAVIVQDLNRLSELCKDLCGNPPSSFIIPNSCRGSNETSIPSSYLHRLIGIQKECFVATVLSAGMICDEVYSIELAKSFGILGHNYALIYHERQSRSPSEEYLARLINLNSVNLYLSLNPVEYSNLDSIYQSADIGIAMYRPVDSNFSEIAHASGKLSFYLKHGKPVIMNNIDSLRRLNDKYNIGVIVNDISDSESIASAVQTLMSDYQSYSQRALFCFNEEYNFSQKAKPFLHHLTRL